MVLQPELYIVDALYHFVIQRFSRRTHLQYVSDKVPVFPLFLVLSKHSYIDFKTLNSYHIILRQRVTFGAQSQSVPFKRRSRDWDSRG